MNVALKHRAGPQEALLHWLATNHVEHELHQHSLTYTARETACAEGVDPRSFAKVVAVKTQAGGAALLVLDATDRLDLPKAADALGTHSARLLTEAELAVIAPDAELGALPAVGSLFGLPTYADRSLRANSELSFNAGSHRLCVRVDRLAWERAAAVIYADLVTNLDWRPAWI